jgi:glycosyltransferase involved in cell wall biosynthesis
VIATNVGGLADVVQAEETAIVVPVGDGVSLEAAIERVLGGSSEMQEMGSRARVQAVEKFSENMIVAQYMGLLAQLVEERREVQTTE